MKEIHGKKNEMWIYEEIKINKIRGKKIKVLLTFLKEDEKGGRALHFLTISVASPVRYKLFT